MVLAALTLFCVSTMQVFTVSWNWIDPLEITKDVWIGLNMKVLKWPLCIILNVIVSCVNCLRLWVRGLGHGEWSSGIKLFELDMITSQQALLIIWPGEFSWIRKRPIDKEVCIWKRRSVLISKDWGGSSHCNTHDWIRAVLLASFHSLLHQACREYLGSHTEWAFFSRIEHLWQQ